MNGKKFMRFRDAPLFITTLLVRGHKMEILMIVGYIISFVGGIWFLFEAFSESIWWGLGCLIVPFVSLIFLIMYWGRAGRPFLIQLAGFALVFIGALMSA